MSTRTFRTGDAAPAPIERLTRQQLLLIGILIVATFVVILNETVMTIALPELQRTLGVAPSVGQWLTTAFMLTMAVVIPTTGFLIQRFGTRVLFIGAMTAFTAGTVAAALAPGFEVLLAARVVQAVGTAIMLPLLMTTVMNEVPESRRGVMMGNISVVIAVAPALGPTMSGFIIEHFGWRWVFGAVAPIALVTLVAGALLVRATDEPVSTPIDYLSLPLSVIGFGGVVYGLASIGKAAESGGDGGGMPMWVPFGLGVLGLIGFVARQLRLQRSERALLDLRVFSSRTYTIAIVTMIVGFGMMLGTFIVVPYFGQTALGLSPLTTGLVTLPGGLLMGLAGPIVGRIYDVRGPRPLVIPGAVLAGIGVWMLAIVSTETTVGWLVAANALLCLGLAAMFTPLMTLGLGALDRSLYSHGSAVLGTLQQVAGALGTALFITVMTVVATAQMDSGMDEAAATATGVSRVFILAGVLSLFLLVLVCFVRKPAP